MLAIARRTVEGKMPAAAIVHSPVAENHARRAIFAKRKITIAPSSASTT